MEDILSVRQRVAIGLGPDMDFSTTVREAVAMIATVPSVWFAT